MSLVERGPADTVMALALVHYLALSGNVPLGAVAAFFARLGRTLIIEFVAKTDSQAQRLLRNRPDIFPDYTSPRFERAFGEFFVIADCQRMGDADRWIYLMTWREPSPA
jgi:hypothetical protein